MTDYEGDLWDDTQDCVDFSDSYHDAKNCLKKLGFTEGELHDSSEPEGYYLYRKYKDEYCDDYPDQCSEY